MKNLTSIKDLTESELLVLLDFAEDIKKNPKNFQDSLRGKTGALLFQKTSTRTRISFEAGMAQLGAHAIYVDWKTTNLHLGALEDEIR